MKKVEEEKNYVDDTIDSLEKEYARQIEQHQIDMYERAKEMVREILE